MTRRWLPALLTALCTAFTATLVLARSADFDVRQYQGTKRAYPFQTAHADPIEPPPGYEIIQLYLISRHGTRYPGTGDIDSFNSLVDHFRAHAEKVPEAVKWAWESDNPFPRASANLLAQRGVEELYGLGKRTFARYPTLLKNIKYNANAFRFRSSEVSRSGQSGSAFATGIFEGQGRGGCSTPVYITTIPKDLDQELSMKNACPRWVDEVKKGNRWKTESSEYAERRLKPIAERMSREVFGEVPLTPEHVRAMHRLCGYLVAHHNDAETWCSVFREEELAYLEYLEDMIHFIKYSYGSELNHHMGCPLAHKLAESFTEAMIVDEKPELKAEFMFGHAETIMFFATFLGLYRDPFQLTANLSDSEIRDRRFRTSLFVPFGANIMFELFRRLATSEASSEPDHLIRLLINESPAIIPNVSQTLDGGYYTADAVIAHFLRHGECRFTKECEKQESGGWVNFRVQQL